jgi:hypothetical protein
LAGAIEAGYDPVVGIACCVAVGLAVGWQPDRENTKRAPANNHTILFCFMTSPRNGSLGFAVVDVPLSTEIPKEHSKFFDNE